MDTHVALTVNDVAALLTADESSRLFLQVRIPEAEEVLSALVLLVNTVKDIEESCLCLFSGHPKAITASQALPVLDTLRISTTQLAPDQQDDTKKARSTDFAVTFSDPSHAGIRPLSVVISDHEQLQDLLSEVRRLMQIAGQHPFSALRLQRLNEDGTDTNKITVEQTLSWTHRFDSSLTPDAQGTLTRSASTARKQLISKPQGLRVKPTSNAENPSDVEDAIRSSYINRQLHLKRPEYTEIEQLKVNILNWNVASKEPKTGCCQWINETPPDADLVIIGLQEVDMTQAALFRYQPERQHQWEATLASALASESWHYTKIAAKQLVGLLLLVYVKKELEERISAVEMSTVATGTLGFANKGAVGCHLRVDDTSLVFVDCHLAAFENMRDRRNEDFTYITNNMSFQSNEDLDNVTKVQPDLAKTLPRHSIYHSQHTFVFGDLNYRIELSNTEVRTRLEKGERASLHSHDQLQQEKNRGVFRGYHEGDIDFDPTYRFDVGSSAYDSSEKQRTPSWTDRILWFAPQQEEKVGSEKDQHDMTIKLDTYRSHMSSVFSDHKPVSSSFSVPIEHIVPEKRADIRRQIISNLDEFENTHQPRIKLRPNNVEFPRIAYGESLSRTIACENVGNVAAEFRFAPKPGPSEEEKGETCPPWLQINPMHGLLLPGELVTLTFDIALDKALTTTLNSGLTDIETTDLLILSLTNGRDLFVQVTTGGYSPTFLCCPLEGLSKTSGAIGKLEKEERERILGRNEGELLRKLPNELKQMTEFLSRHAMDISGLFISPAESNLVRAIRSELDAGNPLDLDSLASLKPKLASRRSMTEMDMGSLSLTIEKGANAEEAVCLAAGQLLLDWAEALPIPVVPFELYGRALLAEEKESAYKVLVQFPEAHQLAFMHIIAFLKTYLDRSQSSVTLGSYGSRADRLAVVFSNVLVRPDPRSFADKAIVGSPAKRKRFLLMFLCD